LDLAQFREVEDFARLGFSLDEATTRLIEKELN
jgi:F0F1-type ATP synthase alpha subunit